MEQVLPKTFLGWLSVILVVLFVLVVAATISGIVKFGPTDSPPVVEAVVGMIAGITGAFALARRERALLVIIGMCITLPISLFASLSMIGGLLGAE